MSTTGESHDPNYRSYPSLEKRGRRSSSSSSSSPRIRRSNSVDPPPPFLLLSTKVLDYAPLLEQPPPPPLPSPAWCPLGHPRVPSINIHRPLTENREIVEIFPPGSDLPNSYVAVGGSWRLALSMFSPRIWTFFHGGGYRGGKFDLKIWEIWHGR